MFHVFFLSLYLFIFFCFIIFYFLYGTAASNGSGSPDYRGFSVTLGHTTLGRISLGK